MTRLPAALVALLASLMAPAGAAAAQEPPELSVPATALQLDCPRSFADAGREPVLLVHGTGVTGRENWGWNWLRALPRMGFDVCAVTLPERSLDDIQVAAEHVVRAVRVLRRRSGRPVDVVGHSQGPLEPRWAIKWWPDVRASVDDLVGIAAPNHGATAIDLICAGPTCLPAAWQMTTGAAFLRALNAGDETPGAVEQTSIASRTDGLVVPTETSRLDGAANLVLDDLCPGRITDHLRELQDAAILRLAVDALTHAGPAVPARIGGRLCDGYAMDGAQAPDPELAARILLGALPRALAPGEPSLRDYALAAPAPDAAVPLAIEVRRRAPHAGRRRRLDVRVVETLDGERAPVHRAEVRVGAARALTDREGRARLVLARGTRSRRTTVVATTAYGGRGATEVRP